uniref:Eukaryotic peptide chain release factor GTP-binding subunit n=1 Tax=Ogataea pini TaxID=4923 RepID=ERF3_OGAPI|nr:RecName: Full=Eukaryotic peptide chain release factor GTP-binding subunit; AltName: Full=ERF-3; Short=ERF3; AltName: Full=ERF2; AltName: Full=Omnipotent suppressor protein 2; AltName: Full=Polypeptide release factor 3; AltName: Full=Translation release factor 3 [Ogataea pini]CAA40231.1 EF-1alpha-like protein factor [Ogataea pini]
MSQDQQQQQQFNANNLAGNVQNINLNAPAYDPAVQSYIPNTAQAFVPSAQPYIPGQQEQQFGQYGQQQQNYNQGGYNNYNNRGGYSNNRGGYNNSNRGGYSNYNSYNTNSNQGGYSNYNNNYANNSYNNNNNYNNNYNQGYNNYNSQPQGQDQQQETGSGQMSLEDYQKQQKESLNKLNTKPKKVLKLNLNSSTVKAPIVTKKKEEEPVNQESKTEEPAKEEIKNQEPAEAENKVEEESKVEAPTAAKPVSESEFPASTPKTEAKASKEVAAAAAALKKEVSQAKKESNVTNADALVKEQEEQIDASIVNDMFGGKDHMSIIFMGHVDAGKSTMGGNLLFLTGAVDKRTVEKYEREAKDAGRQGWYLSWIMDTNKEERNDGKTIEVGKSYFETDKRRYTILDAPGHKLYISEMIGGASQADVGVLVISSRKGEYEAGFERGGQSREHAILAKTQGVNKLVVVINKMDDPTVNWSKERYEECTTKLAMYLKGVGYQKGDVLFMPVSGYTGAGLKERVSQKDAPWYNGPSLLEYLDSMPLAVRKINDPFMLPISSKMKDLGTVIEGKIESGHVKKGQNLLVMPNKTQVEVTTIYNETEAEADSAFCGEQVRLRLRGIEEEDLSAGYVLSSINHPVKTVTRFEAQIAIVELKSILSTGFSCVMHVHTAIEEVTFTQLLHNLQKGTNRRSKKAPAFAKQGMKIIAVLETTEPVCIESYDDYPQLGRFTLRDQGQTIAIGKVTKLL